MVFILIWNTNYDYHHHCHFLFIVYLLFVKDMLNTLHLLSDLLLSANCGVDFIS